jgi:gas vesicle protein
MSPETLLALGGLITGVLGAVGALIVSRRSAKKDEVTLLREEIVRLQDQRTKDNIEIEKWRKRYNSLFNYVLQLRTILADNGIDIPLLEEDGGIEEEDGGLSPLTTRKKKIIPPVEPVKPEKTE